MGQASLKGKDILVLEDEVFLRKELGAFLRRKEARVTEKSMLAEARKVLRREHFDYVLLDINLPDGNALELLRAGEISANAAVVVMTAEGSVASAVEAMRLGALDYLAKPFDPDELPLVFERCRETRQRQRDLEHRRDSGPARETEFCFGAGLETVRQHLNKILEADRRLAERPPPVLIEGETGTGKSAIARWLHYSGPRAGQPLIEVNCSVLPETLAESELFGHERGAFTDARKERIGLFEAAHGGTLFLDEISSLSPAIQAKVLTAIEERVIRRVGGNRSKAADARLIAASLHNLEELAAQGRFRDDLFHRLNLLRLRLPPLRERREDIPALAGHLLGRLRRRYRLEQAEIAPEGMVRLQACLWPGNVRELAHEIERALILEGSGPLRFENLPAGDSPETKPNAAADWLNPGWAPPEEGFSIERANRRFIELALRQSDGNVSAAARLLGVPRDFVRYRLKKKKES